MAAGAFVMYQHALEDLAKRLLDLASNTFVVTLVSHGYTPNAKSHSNWTADIAPFIVTTSGYADRTLASLTVARQDDSYVAQDAADCTLSATVTMKAKYAVISVASRPVYYCDLETGNTTGVEATQIILQFNALGIGRIRNPN